MSLPGLKWGLNFKEKLFQSIGICSGKVRWRGGGGYCLLYVHIQYPIEAGGKGRRCCLRERI